MRLSLALSALAGGLVLGWTGLAGAATPPAAAPPAAPIFYCPTPPAATTAPAAGAHTPNGAGCPATHAATPAVVHHRVERHHERVTVRLETPPPPPMARDDHGQGTGHMFWYRFRDAMNDIRPSCPNRWRDCPPEPAPPIVRMIGPPQDDGAYAREVPPQPPPVDFGPPCRHLHHGCPPDHDGLYAQAPPPPAPPIDLGPPCPRVHHGCPPAPDFEAQMTPPPAPAPVEVRPPCPGHRDGCRHHQDDEALTSQLPPPPPADLGPPCPRVHHTCPQVRDDGYAEAAPPPPAPPPMDVAPPCPRVHHDCPQARDDGYTQAEPPPPPAPQPYVRRDERRYDDEGAYADAGPPVTPYADRYARQPPPAPPPAYVEHGQRDGYTYQRSESEHSSGWSYSEQNGQAQEHHWDDRDGARPAPPAPRPPCPRDGCRADPPAYADGSGQWQDGSYGQVYPVAGRDAHGYLVWPGKSPQ